MKTGVIWALCSAAIFAFSAQTPAPAGSPPALATKPLRHLEYTFGVTYASAGEGHTSGIGTVGSGIVSFQGTAGRQGTLIADVVGVAQDGGLVIIAREVVQGRVEQRPPVTCAVYGDSRVLCGDRVNPPTDAITALLAHLGRNFYDPSLVDDNGHWKRQFDGKDMSIDATYSMPNHVDGKPAMIYEHRDIKSKDGTQSDYAEDSRVSYDTAMSVPDTIVNEAVQSSRGDAYQRAKIDLTLTKDSFATH